MDLKNENDFLAKGIQTYTNVSSRLSCQKADMWKQDAEVTEKIRKVKGDIGPFTISLEEWDPGIVA